MDGGSCRDKSYLYNKVAITNRSGRDYKRIARTHYICWHTVKTENYILYDIEIKVRYYLIKIALGEFDIR